MEPLKRITINFQEIFKDQRKNHLDVQNSFTHSSSNPISLHDQTDSISENTKDIQFRFAVQKYNSPQISDSQENIEIKEVTLNKLIKKKETVIRKREQGDSSKITEKLYQNKTSVCSKKSHHKNVEKNNNKNQTPQKSKKELIKNNSNGRHQQKIYDRLYNMSRSQLLKQLYFPTQISRPKSQQKKLSTVKSNKYLKNYVPFEKRLDQYLAQGDSNLNQSIISKSSEKQFRPQLIRNKYTDKIQSKYNKNQIKQLKASQIAQFLNSSVSSSLSSQSRSAQIMQKVQEHFLQKQNDEIQISQESISLLTEVQFHILQPFIMQMQEYTSLKGINFQQRFRQFYNSLQFSQKMSLRNHQAKIKSKYLQMRQQVKEKKKQLTKIQQKKSKLFKKEETLKKTNNHKSNYHLAIQQFI